MWHCKTCKKRFEFNMLDNMRLMYSPGATEIRCPNGHDSTLIEGMPEEKEE